MQVKDLKGADEEMTDFLCHLHTLRPIAANIQFRVILPLLYALTPSSTCGMDPASHAETPRMHTGIAGLTLGHWSQDIRFPAGLKGKFCVHRGLQTALGAPLPPCTPRSQACCRLC